MTGGRHDWRMVPLAAAAWVGSFLGTLGTWSAPWVVAAVASLGLVAASAAAGRRAGVFLVTLTVLVVGLLAGARVWLVHNSDAAGWAADRERVVAAVRLSTEPRLAAPRAGRPDLGIAEGRLLEVSSRHGMVRMRQSVVVFGSDEGAAHLMDLTPGATYRIGGRAAPTDPGAPEPLTIRMTGEPVELSGPGALDRLVNQLRGGLRQAASHSPPDQAALVPSLVVGDTELVSRELSEKFRVTALSHLLAVSGANLTLMLSVVLIAVRTLGLRGWAVRIVALGCVGLFVVLCRFEGSVVRAGTMGLVTLLAMGMGSGQRTLRGIAVATLLLMFLDPWLSRDYAFALSVSACLGLALWAQPWIETMSRWAPRWLAEAFCVPLAAQLATQPIITSLSGQISVVGVFANVVSAPFVGPTTVLGLLASITSFFPPVAAVLAWLAGWCVQPIIWVAQHASQLPSAAITWPATTPGVLGSLCLCLCLGALSGRVVGSRRATGALVVILLVATLVRPVPLGWPGRWAVTFCDVGQGDATVLRAGDGVAVVVDTGPEPRATTTCLDQLGVRRVPVLVLTHFHADHIGGTAAVLERFRPEVVLVSPLASPAHAAAAVEQAAGDVGARVVTAVPGQEFRVGDVHWTTLGAWRPGGSTDGDGFRESATENDSSIVALADVAGLRVVLPGDAEPAGQRRAIAEAGRRDVDVTAHVLKLPHHGAAAQDPDFFRAVGAQVAVVSAGRDNSYGHPASATLELARSHGMHVVSTAEQGSLALSLTRSSVEVRPLGLR